MRHRTAAPKKFRDGGQVRAEQVRRTMQGAPEEENGTGRSYNRLLKGRREAEAERRTYGDGETFAEQSTKNSSRVRIARALGDLAAMSGRDRAQAAAELAAGSTQSAARAARRERLYESMLDDEGKRINQRRDATRVTDNGYKKGGLIKKSTKRK